MSETDPGIGGVNAEESLREADGRSGDERPFPWLLRQKIAVPDRVAAYLDRVGLVEWAMPTRRRLTVLQAPGGFGKTTLLAECCRRLREDGIPTAWVSVDEQDEPDMLDTYIAYACQSAAAGVAADTVAGSEKLASPGLDKARGGSESRTGLAVREIADLEGPFVLVFDELERLGNPGSAALLDFLLQRGPPNLHLAFACRQLPAGVNVAGAVLEGRAAILSTDELRFSKSEVADFFDGRLSRPRLAALMSESAGWPFALRISRNELGSGQRGHAGAAQEFVENWVESRLFAGLGEENREFLLDIGLFEWMDTALLDNVLERSDSMRRIGTMPSLVGLLEPVRDGRREVWRLHPLIREYCARRRFRETPQRFRSIHRRIAGALMRRGETVVAMRHAVEAGEPDLAGDILERAGSFRVWLREGLVQFLAADRWLGEEVIEARSRLALAHCLALILSGRLEEARARYRSVAARLGGLDAEAGDAEFELAVDNSVVRGMLALYGGERFGSDLTRTLLADLAQLAASPRVDVLTRGHLEHGQCIASSMTAEFGAALEHAARARQCFGESRYMTMYIDVQVGQVAMAQGRVRDAEAYYRRAQRVANNTYVLDAVPAAICGGLLQELALECDRAAPGAALARVPEALAKGSSPYSAYAAAAGAAIELRLRDEGVDGALAAADKMLDYVQAARLPALARYVSALRVSLLAIAGRIGDGEEAWALDDLPEEAADCLDLAGQGWREMEALSCARLRLTIGRERFEAARGFADALRAVAAARGLRRTLMRGLSLSVVLEHRAGEAAAAAGHLEAYLRLYAETPYAGPLVRERADCAQMLAAFLESAPESSCKETARSLLTAMVMADPRQSVLSVRERQVLQRLEEGQQDKEIAAALGLSAYGVRYHIRNMFTKLGARNRAEVVRCAREMGLTPAGIEEAALQKRPGRARR